MPLQAIEGLKGDNEEQNVGIALLRRAVESPLRQIVANAGDEPSVVVDKVNRVPATTASTLLPACTAT